MNITCLFSPWCCLGVSQPEAHAANLEEHLEALKMCFWIVSLDFFLMSSR